jgi:hypothetical protein
MEPDSRTRRRNRIAINVVAAIVVPFVLQTLFIIGTSYVGPTAPWRGNIGSLVVSAAVGFIFIVRAFGIYSVAIGCIYLPAMVYALFGYVLSYNSGVSWHDWLWELWQRHI